MHTSAECLGCTSIIIRIFYFLSCIFISYFTIHTNEGLNLKNEIWHLCEVKGDDAKGEEELELFACLFCPFI